MTAKAMKYSISVLPSPPSGEMPNICSMKSMGDLLFLTPPRHHPIQAAAAVQSVLAFGRIARLFAVSLPAIAQPSERFRRDDGPQENHGTEHQDGAAAVDMAPIFLRPPPPRDESPAA